MTRFGVEAAGESCAKMQPSNLRLSFSPPFGRRQLVSADSCDDSVLSYGVRNSIAAYLSFSESPEATYTRAESRTKKSRSVYALPDHDYDV